MLPELMISPAIHIKELYNYYFLFLLWMIKCVYIVIIKKRLFIGVENVWKPE